MNNPLVDLWQREIDGVAKSYIRNCAVYGIEKFAALDSLANGASFEAVAEAYGKPQPRDALAGRVDPARPVSREFIEGLKQAGARKSLIEILTAEPEEHLTAQDHEAISSVSEAIP